MKRGMPFFDRFWWLRSFWVVAFAAALLCLLWLGIEAPQQPSELDANATLLYLSVCVGICGALWWNWRQMRKARRHLRARMAAIAGNQDAVPLARYAVDASDAPDIVAAPLVVEYPSSRWRTPFWSRLRVAAGILGIPYMMGIVVWTFSPRYEVLGGVAVLLFILLSALGILSLPELRRSFMLAYRSGRRLTATLEGIEWEPVLGRTRFLRWDEARLLEVSRYTIGPTRSGSQAERRRYTLYGASTTLWWNDLGETYDKPSGDGARLLALIRARTGLVPRSFDAELRADTLRILPVARPVSPLPPTSTLQLAAGETNPTAAQPAQVYTLVTHVTTNHARAIAGGIGLLLCLGGAAAVVWTLSMLQLVRTPDAVNGLINWLNGEWATLLGIGGMFGCPLLIAAARPPGTVMIQADALGLRLTRPGNRVLVRWNDVASITYSSVRNTNTYVVIGWGAAATVVWPAHIPPGVRAQAEPGTVAVTPDELAAIVAERSGKPVETRRLW